MTAAFILYIICSTLAILTLSIALVIVVKAYTEKDVKKAEIYNKIPDKNN